MNLDELTERRCRDLDGLRAVAAAEVGDVPMVVGGSLADNLGHAESDIDVYCFVAVGETELRPVVSSDGLRMDLHLAPPSVVEEARLLGYALLAEPSTYEFEGSRDCCLAPLHALACGVPLHRANEVAALRLRSRADLVSFHFATAALNAFGWLAAEAVALYGEVDEVTELLALVRATEAAIDAALGAAGRACPNPKWRFALVSSCGPSFPVPPEHVAASLVPGRQTLREPRAAMLRTISSTVAAAVDHPLLRPTAAAERARLALAHLGPPALVATGNGQSA